MMKKLSRPTTLLIIFVILNLVIALFIADDFGRSTDEAPEFRRAGIAVDIYFGDLLVDLAQPYEKLGEMSLKGTAVTGLIRIVERVLFPNTDHSTKVVAHYCYFVFFQLAVIGVYLLGNHFYDQWISLSVAVLFGTQPLLFGHGFINPKDIPLLSMFLLTVAAGFKMVDNWIAREETKSPIHSDQVGKTIRFLVGLLLIVLVLWSRSMVTSLVLNGIEYAYTTGETSQVGRIFASLTTSGSLEGYLTLAQIYLSQFFRWFTFISVIFVALVFHYANKHRLFDGKINWILFTAAAIWGIAISTRVIAIAAGGIIGLYALIRLKQKAIFPLAVYSLLAGFFSYFSWPFFWVYGLRGYFTAMGILDDFPWYGQVLFEGVDYHPQELPARYLPKLMGLQFTEPLVILTLIGLLLGLYLLYRKRMNFPKLVLLYAWFILPMLYVIIMKPVVYTNFRHFLFSIPPLFISAGLTLGQIMERLKKPIWKVLLVGLVLIPGLVSIVQTHPYEYIYYNNFVGGIDGAYQNYETDYWGLAYKDAMSYINENALPGSKIIVWKNNLNGKHYANKEFDFKAHSELTKEEMLSYDYAIIPFGRIAEFKFLEGVRLVYTASHGKANFVSVLEIPD